jgi:hypothetical protein
VVHHPGEAPTLTSTHAEVGVALGDGQPHFPRRLDSGGAVERDGGGPHLPEDPNHSRHRLRIRGRQAKQGAARRPGLDEVQLHGEAVYVACGKVAIQRTAWRNARMVPLRNPLRLYWHMADHFLEEPGDWRFLASDWRVERDLPTKRALRLVATLTAGLSFKTGKFTMAARVQVKGGTSDAFSRAAVRELAEVGILDDLRRHGFRWGEPFAYHPLGAWKSVFPKTFASEREFLSKLAGRSGGAKGHAPRSLSQLVAAFRGTASGAWRPSSAQWELRRPVVISERPATAICMFHIAPVDLEGRLSVAASVTIWPPWNRKGRLPIWLAGSRRTLREQFRAAGHQAEWHRGPDGRGVMITSMRRGLRNLADVLRERRLLEAAHFGDPS